MQRTCERLIRKSEFEIKVNKAKSDTRVLELVGDDKFDRLVANAVRKLKKDAGEWVSWRTIRPAYRDRAEWDDAIWDHLSRDKSIEVHEEAFGGGVRRKAKWLG